MENIYKKNYIRNSGIYLAQKFIGYGIHNCNGEYF